MIDQATIDTDDETSSPIEDDGSEWYVVHSLSHHEARVADSLNKLAESSGAIKEVLIPTEKVIEMRRGQRREIERRLMPGYLLVRMIFDRKSYYDVMEQPSVIGFLGADDKPKPLSKKEISHIKEQVSAGVERPRPSITFVEGEEVRVIDGPFESFTGQVEEVNEEQARLKVSVMIFGRATPVDLEFGQVQRTS